MNQPYDYLNELGVSYERVDHRPVFTVEEARRLVPPIPGVPTKNLFLRDDKGRRHFLLVTRDEKQVDLKAFAAAHALPKLGFASPERLLRLLGLTPGSVSLLALMNDRERQVELLIDEELRGADRLLCHPLDNAATLSIAMPDVLRFVQATGHEAHFAAVPAKSV